MYYMFHVPIVYMYMYRYGCDIAHTPMIVSDSFVQSGKARDVEFTTNKGRNI